MNKEERRRLHRKIYDILYGFPGCASSKECGEFADKIIRTFEDVIENQRFSKPKGITKPDKNE